jgi:hypothetical protein
MAKKLSASEETRQKNEALKQSAADELARAARSQSGREQVAATVEKITGRRPTDRKPDCK